MSLRPYQAKAVEEIEASMERRKLLVMPTGAGKTVVAAELAKREVERGGRVLVLAHRRELVFQGYEKLGAAGVDESLRSILMSKDARYDESKPIQVASLQTLSHRRLSGWTLAIVDEAHRAVTESYDSILDREPSAKVLGMTATPYRLDGFGLGNKFDVLIEPAKPSELIADGYLARPSVFTVPVEKLPDVRGVRKTMHEEVGVEFNQRELARAVNQGALVGDVVDHWKRRAGGRRTVVFAVGIEHSKALAAAFQREGARAVHIDGSTAKHERTRLLAAFERDEIDVICNCEILCEGWDSVAAKCVILARPTMSRCLYVQQPGRVMRPFGPMGAVTPIVLDHAGNVVRHNMLPHADQMHELTVTDAAGRTKVQGVKTCRKCFAVVARKETKCPECGTSFPERPRDEPEWMAGDLVEVNPPTREEVEREYRRVLDHMRGKIKDPFAFARKVAETKFGEHARFL